MLMPSLQHRHGEPMPFPATVTETKIRITHVGYVFISIRLFRALLVHGRCQASSRKIHLGRFQVDSYLCYCSARRSTDYDCTDCDALSCTLAESAAAVAASISGFVLLSMSQPAATCRWGLLREVVARDVLAQRNFRSSAH